MMPWFFWANLHRLAMPGMASNSSHHIGMPSCLTCYSNHISRLLTEGLASRFFSSATESLFSGSWKLTLLFWGLPRDWDHTHWGSAWEQLWLWVLTWPLEWSLDQFSRLGPRLTSRLGPRSTPALTADSWPSPTFVIEPLKVILEGFGGLQGFLVGGP